MSVFYPQGDTLSIVDFDFISLEGLSDRCERSSARSRHRRELLLARRRRRRIFALALGLILLLSLALGLPRALQPVMDKASASQLGQHSVRSAPAEPERALTVSPRALRMIAGFEGFFARVYNDPAGHCTIGYGTLLHLGPCTEGDRASWGRLDRDQALSLMRQEIDGMEREIRAMVKVSLSQNQYDAIVSFAYNCGTSALRRSTFLALLNRGLYRRAARQLVLWDKAGGQTLPGLTRRRAAEQKLFLSG